MTRMQQAVSQGSAIVARNIVAGIDNDTAKEQAIAMFRAARCALPPAPFAVRMTLARGASRIVAETETQDQARGIVLGLLRDEQARGRVCVEANAEAQADFEARNPQELWIVTTATAVSELVDVMFRATPISLARQFAGGLEPDRIVGWYAKEADAFEIAQAEIAKARAVSTSHDRGTTLRSVVFPGDEIAIARQLGWKPAPGVKGSARVESASQYLDQWGKR